MADADVVLLVGSQVSAGDHFLPMLEISGYLTSIYCAAVPIQADARAAMSALASARNPAG